VAALDASFASSSSSPAAYELSELRHRRGTSVQAHDGLHIEIQPLQVSSKRPRFRRPMAAHLVRNAYRQLQRPQCLQRRMDTSSWLFPLVSYSLR